MAEHARRHTIVTGLTTLLLGLALVAGCVPDSDESVPPAGTERYQDLADKDFKKFLRRTGVTLAEKARLVFVTDGDTLKVVFSNGSRASVRLIGIDTPETYPQLECGGDQATASMEKMIRPGDELGLYVDPSQHQVDRYGRLLRYVFATNSNDLDVGHKQIQTGNATAYVYNGNPFALYSQYKSSEQRAQERGDGIWGTC